MSSDDMNAVGGVHGLLPKLYATLSDSDTRNAALKCHDIIGDLGQECMLTQSENELVLQTSLLFSKEQGLLTFLKKTLTLDKFVDTRVEILSLVEKFLQRITKSVKSWTKTYAVDIRDACMTVYTKDKSAKCRVASLDLLIKVLYLTKDSSIAQDMKVGDIVNKFYSELCQKTKLPDTVLGKIYELLGVLGEVHPSEMINNSEKLYKAFLGELREQMTSLTKEPKLAVVAGCLKGITALMVNFTKSTEDDPKTSKEIFDFAMKTISPQMEIKRYAVTIAGLKLFAKHASQLSSSLMEHYKAVFEVMSKLCGHINAEIKKTSYYALESFLKQVASVVAENVELHKSKLKFFMQKFCSIIKTMDSSHKELSIAIRGYGFFASPCKVVCPQDVDLMYVELIQRCKQMYLTETDGEDESVYQLPSFLDSIASVLIHLEKVPEVYTPVLERLMVVQIDSFPQYSSKMQPTCSRAVLKVFVAMASKGPVLWSFISSVVHQGLIRVCSKPVHLPEEGSVYTRSNNNSTSSEVHSGRWKIPSCNDYLDLFRNLLDCDHLKDSGFLDGAFDVQNSYLKSLSRILYDELIRSILKIVEKLDLSLQKANMDEESSSVPVSQGQEDVSGLVSPSSDPSAHLQPNKPKDFTAFINLVDFCSELLLKKHVEYFEQWVYPLSHELILQSIRSPLVSGFYKLLSVSMVVAKKIQYFQGVGPKRWTSVEIDPVKCTSFALFSKFGKEVSVRMKQYKDELLASSLMFVLSLHHDIVALDIKVYVPALQVALKLGLSHTPLADAALDALEVWSRHIPAESMQPFYRDILPHLDGYLKTADTNDNDEQSLERMSVSSGKEKGYGIMMKRLLKMSKNLTMEEDAPLAMVRRRVVRLLGHLGGQHNRNLVTATSDEEMMKKFVAWDTQQRLSFAVPFTDMKPVIYLDPFLPRIAELALSTSDRQTKVAACELFHSVVIYMIGKGSQIVEGENSPPMYNLHKRIFPVLLRLACDVDQVTRQLFEPLVMQLIHWFTSNKKFESQDTVAVLEAILDGLIDSEDSTLRDFCGRCLQEFVKWSIKQTSPKQQENSPTNIKSVFKRIYSLALHPNGFKRLGAALAFNNIYRQFREENSLVEQFVFETLVIFVESMTLAHADEKSMGTLQQCSSAIDHLKRIIKCKADSLNQHNAKRRIPRGFPKDERVCLSDVVMWLLEQCGRPQTECRHKCMELFYEFVPLLPGKKSLSQWLEGVLMKQDEGFLVAKFEGGGLFSQPTLGDLSGPFSVRATLQWMDLLLAALDCYNTFIGLHIVKPHLILGSCEKSNFLKAVGWFLSTLATQGLETAESCFTAGQKTSFFSLSETDQYNYSKCTIIVRLFEFATMVLAKCQQDFWKVLEKDLFNPSFFELAALCVCQPSSVGFNMADLEVMTRLPEVCVHLLKALVASTYRTNLEGSISTKISNQSLEKLCSVDLYDSHTSHAEVEMLLSACKQIHKAGFLNSILQSQDQSYAKRLGSRLLMAVYRGIAPGEEKRALPSMDVRSRRLADGLLHLAFSLGGQSDQVVDLLLNTIMLSVPLSECHNRNFLSFSHGEYFYSLFQTTVNSELLSQLNSTVPQLMKAATHNPSMVSVLLNGMLDHSFRERVVRKNHGSRLVELVLQRWDCLHPWWGTSASTPESKTATLVLLSKLLQIDSSVCSNPDHEAFRVVFTTFTTLIVDTTLPLNLKSQALIILPFFTTLPEGPLGELQRGLEALVASHFPMQSDEFSRGSLQRNNYMECIRKFLDALELSQSPMLMKLLAEVLCRDKIHIMEDLFQTCFQKIARQSNPERQALLLSTVYETFQQGDVPIPSMVQAMLERVLLPLASHCGPKALEDFFIANISTIMASLHSRFTKSSEAAFEAQLIKKNGCYKLMELLYSRLPKEQIYSKNSQINQAFSGKGSTEGNELSKALIKSCFEAFTENMTGENQLLEQRRQYHCAAYNCAMAVISCSFNETKFYQGFLFTEKPEKNQFIFENIINTERTYRFPIEVEVPLERKKKYIMVRKEVSEENGENPVYLSSQSYMADSSLSEEMSQFDFSTGVQSFSYSSQKAVGQMRTSRKREATETEENVTVDLEMDELNQHECMATMTALLGHMQRNSITPKVEQGSVPSELPPWMKFLHGKLGNPATPLNIQLFISKLIINAEEVFRPYAKFWLGPLLQLVVSGNNGGEGIHFMVVDLVVTVLSWISITSPKGNTRDEVLANRLLEFLMKNCFHNKRPVFRNNLEIIRIVVECWKDCLNIPYNIIYERFCGMDPVSKDNSVGLQLLGIILANNLPAYDPTCGIEYDRYIQSLSNNISFTRYQEVYCAAAEIIGLTLKNLTDNNLPHASLLELTANKIDDLKKKEMEDKFIICLSKVSKHFPPFIDRFVNSVFFLLPKLHGALKTHCLECLLSRAEVIPDIYRQLKTKDFTQIMKQRDEARQRVCLDILHKILALLKPQELQEFLGGVVSFISHPSPACRERMYDILMWIQDNYSDADSMSDSTSEEVLNTAKEILLQGLVDENQGLQLYVRNFWCHEKRLPTVTLERMLVLLESLYSSRIERCFLSLATNLMLEMTSQSPDFKRNMFEYPLSECKFQDYVIDSNWRFRSTVMTPMFVDTQATQGQESLGPQQGAAMSGQLRATQTSLEFSQTQTPGRRTAFNWLTGSSVDTLGEYTQSTDTSSSLLGFGKKAERRSAAWRQTSEGFGTKRLSVPSDEDNSRSKAESERRADILRLRRRFLKDQEKVSLHFAKKEMRQQKEKKDSMAEERLKRESQVTLYRSYRVGDLPDIQIQYSSLIAPLQALAQRDPTLAKQLFSSLFAGVLREMEEHKPTAEKKRIYEKLRSDLNKFLSKSIVFFPPFVACVQDMCHQHTELLQINPALISFSCQASLQQPSGILLLEEGLLHACSSQEPPTKRPRTHKQIPPDTEKWIHLAKLYRSLGEYDVVRGIFGGKIGTKPITSTAVQAEARSDYAEAVTLYNEALNTEDWGGADPTDTEKDFWEIAALEAYNQLGEWKSLQYCSTVNIDENSPVNLDNMWNDSFFQETYLKYMMRSMLKQLQLGERNQALLSFVDSSMKVQERKNLLESQYSQELSLLYILQEDYDRAKYYANSCMQIFMQDYSSVDTLLNQSRLTVLQSVQALIEVQDFLQFITGDVSVKSLKNLIKLWTDRYPDVKMDPINVWDDVITSRCFFLDKICEKLNSTESMEVDEPTGDDNLNQMVQECKFSMKISMADSAWKQSNFPVATKLLKELHRDAKTQRSWLMRWVHSFTRFSHKRSLSQGPLEQISTTLKTIPLLDDLKADFQAASPKVLRDQNVLLGTSYHILASSVSKGSSVLETMDKEKLQRLAQLAGSPEIINHPKIVLGLAQSALKLFSEAVKVADQELQSYSQDCVDTDGVSGAYMALANFCDKQLRKEEQSTELSGFPELLSLPVYVVESVLKALKLNSEEARLKFPRLLQIIELYPTETLDLMAKEMVDVPCWQLIGWISQMLALLDKPEAVAVQSVISQIAECFPQALIYSFIISNESYEFEKSVTGHGHREFVDRIKSVLEDGVTVQNFVDALQQLTNPEMLFKDWWDGVKNELGKPSVDQRMMQRLYDEMHSALGDHKAQGLGAFRKKFIQKFAKDLDKLFGPGGATLLKKRKDKSFLKEVDELLGSMRRSQKEPGNLKEYSPWLSNFKPDTLRNDLEIPGQYDGRSKPLPEYHAKITGFDERVKVMGSLRRPKRIVMRGDDEREHPFLVKGGEDLRQDQRIEQLFIVMNILLNQDTVCAQKHLQLRTYQVVPMTTRIGLIEWMENTCTLKDFLSNSRTEEEQRETLRPNDEYDKWLSRVSPSNVIGIPRYAEVYKRASRNDTINNFVRIEQLVPADLLKRAFLKMSTTPEAFLSLRSHFSTSHALLCVSHWILGIGDRHLSNFMINMETGGMIGIDFGHAFGSATQFIPVPELMPFRLTRQFVNLMQPMKETGLIQSVMVNSLRAYRNDPDLLLNTMDIFVKEPCLDWKNFEIKQLKKGGTWTETVDTKEIHWYPLQKVNFMRRKLEGANPAIITSEELKLGFEKDPAFKQMLSVALGSEEHNVRARLEPESLSVEKQVDCLLDQAMDRNILGRVWSGWEPWI